VPCRRQGAGPRSGLPEPRRVAGPRARRLRPRLSVDGVLKRAELGQPHRRFPGYPYSRVAHAMNLTPQHSLEKTTPRPVIRTGACFTSPPKHPPADSRRARRPHPLRLRRSRLRRPRQDRRPGSLPASPPRPRPRRLTGTVTDVGYMPPTSAVPSDGVLRRSHRPPARRSTLPPASRRLPVQPALACSSTAIRSSACLPIVVSVT
jgi:hypothetical protein